MCVFSPLQADFFSLVNRLARTMLMNTHTHTHTHTHTFGIASQAQRGDGELPWCRSCSAEGELS